MGLESWSTLGKAMDTLTFCSLVMHPKVYVDNFLDVAEDFFLYLKRIRKLTILRIGLVFEDVAYIIIVILGTQVYFVSMVHHNWTSTI